MFGEDDFGFPRFLFIFFSLNFNGICEVEMH